MNSEELELSLRTEFESYLKTVLADVKQEVSEFQTKFQTEFEKHKTQLDDVFQEFAARIENDKEIDEAFKESVIEHLRLARDEGARITASAIAEAEAMEKETETAQAVSYAEIRDAINDISTKDSQSAILKSLVHHAAQFTPRGAFFIIKNEHFVGWRVFGKEGNSDEHAVREVFFPLSDDTILGESVKNLSTAEASYGTHAEDSVFLNKLEFGQPDRMYAIPLVARGRGVAVLYADYGNEGTTVNVEALDALVRVAGLTVELLAASGVKTQREGYQEQMPTPAPAAFYAESGGGESASTATQTDFETPDYSQTPAYSFEESETATDFAPVSETATGFAPVQEEYASHEEETAEPESAESESGFEYEVVSDDYSTSYQEEKAEAETEEPAAEEVGQSYSWEQPAETSYSFEPAATETEEKEEAVEEEYAETAPVQTADYEFESTAVFEKPETGFETPAPTFESPQFEVSQFESPQYKKWESTGYEEPKFETSNGLDVSSGKSESLAPEPVETVTETAVATPQVKSRLSERNVDLPIQVADDERRLHNDARRFARLLVSEIKLYNEQKVKEGREGRDLYERLREAIDRSREMYDKRVQPPVAAKFDYFHYELVSNLAEGDEEKLGSGYPGATV